MPQSSSHESRARGSQRIAYLDWMRGFACLFMFQRHCYDSWLSPSAKQSAFFGWSRLAGTLPAPLFLFLAGVSFALVTDRMRQKGAAASQIARTTILRGAEIFAWGLLFRLQEFLLGQPWAPWTDLFRVDILNIIGVSLMLMGAVCWLASLAGREARSAAPAVPSGPSASPASLRARSIAGAVIAAAAISLATPSLWTTHRPRWLPWYLESYINGVHIVNQPQPWLFPIFPWSAFAFAGLAVGFLLLSPWARRHELAAVLAIAAAGLALYVAGAWLDAQPRQFYAVYDFWHSSPEFFLMRLGIMMGIVLLSYAWCRWGAGQLGFSPFVELGRASLVVYWVHIEFVYGRFSIFTKGAQTVAGATLGLIVIFASMTVLATLRNRLKGQGLEALAFWRRPARANT